MSDTPIAKQLLDAQDISSDGYTIVCQLERDLAAAQKEVSKLTDALDMMKDEFMRIIACPGCNAEIEDLANRAQLKLIQHVPVIVQRDRAQAELAALREDRARLDWLETRKSNTAGNCDHTAEGYWTIRVNDGTSYYKGGNQLNLRQSIDAARKEAAP